MTINPPWYAVGYLNRLGTPFWHVRRDRFAGCDYLLTGSGKRRRFLSEATAKAAIAKAGEAS
jgi:hypothetical protein